MPRAKDNRKAVGTEHCNECSTTARFYQVQTGNRTGYLYRRCECGADQKTGAAVQMRWLSGMARTAEIMIPHPLQARAEPQAEPVAQVEPKPAEPQASSGGNPEKQSSKAGIVGLFIIVGGIAAALLT